MERNGIDIRPFSYWLAFVCAKNPNKSETKESWPSNPRTSRTTGKIEKPVRRQNKRRSPLSFGPEMLIGRFRVDIRRGPWATGWQTALQ